MAVVTIRPASIEDAAAIAEIYVDSWRSTYAGLLPDEVLLRLDAAQREARWWRRALSRRRGDLLIYVAEDSQHGVVGFASGGRPRDRDLDYGGEVYTLYVRDEFHGLGIGRRLFVVMSERLLAGAGASLVVWVLNGNPARYFYETLGGKCVARRNGTMGGAPIEELAFGWADVRELIALGKSGETG